jgi:hypothetical protein
VAAVIKVAIAGLRWVAVAMGLVAIKGGSGAGEACNPVTEAEGAIAGEDSSLQLLESRVRDRAIAVHRREHKIWVKKWAK